MVKCVEIDDIITTNSYFYIDEKSKSGWLLDPAGKADKLLEIIRQNAWKIEKILLTHGHFDHIGAVAQISQALQIPYVAQTEALNYLTDPQMNLSAMCGREIILPNAEYVADGEVICLAAAPETRLQVIHTPGHTQDSTVFYDAAGGVAFVGDTIFKGSIGATHFPGGDEEQIRRSIKQKILTLPENTVLYSGHTPPTSVAAEKSNPYI